VKTSGGSPHQPIRRPLQEDAPSKCGRRLACGGADEPVEVVSGQEGRCGQVGATELVVVQMRGQRVDEDQKRIA
jgi:hypothetical protein